METQTVDPQEPQVGLNNLLEAGVHFGHQTRRWNPKMRKYIFTQRHGIHIIDLRKTLERLEAAKRTAQRVTKRGEQVLFVCTKPQLRDIIQEEARRAGAFYVTERWLGGMLTNFQTIKHQFRRLKELERGQEEGAFEFYTKKEQLLLDRERTKLDRYFSGVKDMSRLPGAVFVVDAHRELIAVREAHRLGIPVVAIADTNADPDLIDYPIPGNDDAIRSVSLISRAISDAILDVKQEAPAEDRPATDEADATTYSTETGEKAAASRDRPTRRRKRRPRPEVIAKLQKSGQGEAGSEELDEATTELTETPQEAAAESIGAVADTSATEAEEAPETQESTPAAEEPEKDEGEPASESETEDEKER